MSEKKEGEQLELFPEDTPQRIPRVEINGVPTRDYDTVAKLWSLYLKLNGIKLTSKDVVTMLALAEPQYE